MGIPVEVKRGTAVIFNGYLHHRSLPKQGASGRSAGRWSTIT